MPLSPYTPDGQSYHGSITRPADGDPAVVASINTVLANLADNSAFLKLLESSAFNILNFGADPTGATSSTTAIQDAIDAAAVAGGIVFVPAGTFEHGLLTIPGGVSLYGVPGASWFTLNHASSNGLVFTAWNDGPPTVVSDIRFIGTVANTGTCVVNNADAHVQFIRCSWNGLDSGGGSSTNLQGKIASVNSSASELEFIDCRIAVGGTATKGFQASNGKITVVGGTVSVPATYAEDIAYVDNASNITLDSVRIDLASHASGTMKVLYAVSSSSSATMIDCVVNATGAAGLIYAFHWIPGVLVVAEGNLFIGSGSVLVPYGGSATGAGSIVEGYGITNGTGGTSVTVPYGVSTYVFVGTSTVPSFTMPATARKYQSLRMYVRNASGADWTTFGTGGAPAIAPIPALDSGQVATVDWQYIDLLNPGTFEWVLVTVSP